ncbi:MAG: peptidoglycan DD-metalloendopeptidase family protein [Porticoccaceae bacterium]
MHQKQRPDFWEDLFANSLPKTHLYAAGAVATLVTALLVLAPSENVSAYRENSLQHYRHKQELLELLPQIEAIPSMDHAASSPADDTDELDYIQLDEQVRPGDNLSEIFKRLSLSSADLHAVANAGKYGDELKRLSPGETVTVILTENNAISEVVYQRSPLESFRYTPSAQGYKGEKLLREPEARSAFRHVTIEHSLFQDGVAAGISHAQIMQIANIFGWDIDFALDIRKGDTFSVLFEDQYIDGKKIGTGTILGAEFTNQGKTHKAVRYVADDGDADYYTPEGQPMKKAFLRSPLDFTRVSSNYNPNRLHPILKTRRPHRGVDYAAPTGTPVYSAGSGKVIKSGFTPANGNYVFVQHGDTYTTRYLHLNKISVKTGQKVKQRQVIGTVGSTGYATGPHLHYEFLVNGTHTNPRTVKLPQAEPIDKQAMASFRKQTAPLLAKLETIQSTQLASLQK